MKQKKNALRWRSCVLLLLAVAMLLSACGQAGGDSEGDVSQIEVVLYGEEQMFLEYGMEFQDPGAVGYWKSMTDSDEQGQLEVRVEGQIDATKLGKQTITYSVNFHGVKAEKVRTVHVVDTTAPIIELVSIPGHFTVNGEEYEEEGYKAFDACDGDLTDQVQRRVEGNTVIYTVTDSSGNRAQVRRDIRYGDKDAPVLTLKGDSSISLKAGSEWDEPGYTAMDKAEGDLTKRVTISGQVNVYVPGTYELVYRVTDSFGNVATAKRTVQITGLRQPDIVKPDGKVIYLTFDDGPSKYTPELLSILKKYNVKAMFFVINSDRLDLLDDIAAGGHTIGIHSKSHRYENIYASEENFFADLYAMQDIIYKYTGIRPSVMRFPGGSSNRVSKKYNLGIMTRLIQAVQAQGFQFFDWNVDSDDAGEATTADQVFENVTKGVKNKQYSVVLQHDTQDFSIDAVERIIVWGLSNGYSFLPLKPNSPQCHHNFVKN